MERLLKVFKGVRVCRDRHQAFRIWTDRRSGAADVFTVRASSLEEASYEATRTVLDTLWREFSGPEEEAQLSYRDSLHEWGAMAYAADGSALIIRWCLPVFKAAAAAKAAKVKKVKTTPRRKARAKRKAKAKS